jgi:predicted nuclease of predicted toxin-antitoxin system
MIGIKFLIDMNLPRTLAVLLTENGHHCRHVGDIGLSQATDEVIVEEARLNGEVILTHDMDYGKILAFSGKSSPSVIIFRYQTKEPESFLRRILNDLPQIQSSLERGAIVVVERKITRIRLLPIQRT